MLTGRPGRLASAPGLFVGIKLFKTKKREQDENTAKAENQEYV
jgi:hypothetical protein